MAVFLVTGGAGFIGSHLVEALLARDHQVRVLDNFSSGKFSHLAGLAVEIVSGDLGNQEVVHRAVQGVDLVFHLAAACPPAAGRAASGTTLPPGAAGTLHLLLAAREAEVKRVIYAADSLPLAPGPRRGYCPPWALSHFPPDKGWEEPFPGAFRWLCDLETVGLRYFHVFGPRQSRDCPHAGVLPRCLEALLAGRSPLIPGDGLQPYDFTYVGDVVQGNLLAAAAPRAVGKVYNIATGRGTTLLQLVDLLNAVLGTAIQPVHGAPGPGPVAPGPADISAAETDLGYFPFTSLEQGLRRCLAAWSSPTGGRPLASR
jgi:UDP-glucose 4-epimerase